MFSARCEYRMSLRADNSDMRVTELAYNAGVVNYPRSLSRIFKFYPDYLPRLWLFLFRLNWDLPLSEVIGNEAPEQYVC